MKLNFGRGDWVGNTDGCQVGDISALKDIGVGSLLGAFDFVGETVGSVDEGAVFVGAEDGL